MVSERNRLLPIGPDLHHVQNVGTEMGTESSQCGLTLSLDLPGERFWPHDITVCIDLYQHFWPLTPDSWQSFRAGGYIPDVSSGCGAEAYAGSAGMMVLSFSAASRFPLRGETS